MAVTVNDILISFLSSSGSLLVRPFFPALSSQSVCDSVTVTDFPSDYVTVTELPTDYVTVTEVLPAVMTTTSDSGAVHLPDLAWPFMLIAGAHLVPVLGFLVISKTTLNMRLMTMIPLMVMSMLLLLNITSLMM